MSMFLFFLEVTCLIALNCLIAYVIGYLQTETAMRIPLNFKPFTCRPCLTFWLAAGLAAGLAVLAAPTFVARDWACYPAAVCGVFGLGGVAALALFFYVKTKYLILK